MFSNQRTKRCDVMSLSCGLPKWEVETVRKTYRKKNIFKMLDNFFYYKNYLNRTKSRSLQIISRFRSRLTAVWAILCGVCVCNFSSSYIKCFTSMKMGFCE